MTPEMEVVAICQEMHWTYWEYMGQPSWFLALVSKKLQMDSIRTKKQLTKMSKSSYR